MRSAPIYEGNLPLQLAVEDCVATERTTECDRCKLNTDLVKSPCISGEGEAGGVLLVGEAPGRNEDALGRPFIGKSGQLLRTELAKHWSGPVALDNGSHRDSAQDGGPVPHVPGNHHQGGELGWRSGLAAHRVPWCQGCLLGGWAQRAAVQHAKGLLVPR